MVLHGFLEDFLHGAGASGRIDNAAHGNGYDAVLANAVVEVFGYVCGKGSGGFVSVEPSGHAQALVVQLGVFLPNGHGGLQPSLIREAWRFAQRCQRILHLFRFPSCHPCAQMRGFHCAGAASRDHQASAFGEPFAQEDNLPVARCGALYAVSAHHAHNGARVASFQIGMQAVADGVVVQGACQCLLDVFRHLSHLQIVLVHPAVKARLQRVRLAGVVAFVQLFGRVQMAAVMECLAHLGEEEAVARLLLEAPWKRASQEDAVGVAVAQGKLRLRCQIDILESASLYLFHAFVQHLRQLPVVPDFAVVLSHGVLDPFRI